MTPQQRRIKYRTNQLYRARSKASSWNRYHNNPGARRKSRSAKLKRLFGITLDEYELLLNEQQSLCAICLKPENVKQQSKIRELAVDHNHVTGKVRALLCNKCNIGIGVFLEDILLLERAKEYLIKWS